jgi:ribosomal protein S27E
MSDAEDDAASDAMMNEGGPNHRAVHAVRCPVCTQTVAPHSQLDEFVVCGSCGATLVVAADGTSRRATGVDVDRLTPEALQHLRTGLAGFRTLRRKG